MISVKDLAFLSKAIYGRLDYDDWKVNEFVETIIDVSVIGMGKKQVGFKAGIYKKGNEAVITFSGSDDILDYWSNLQLGLGTMPPQLDEAHEYYNKHIGSLSYADITITGHSLGGYLAEFIGNRFAKRTVTFNSPGTSGDKRTYAKASNSTGTIVRIYEQSVTYSKEVLTKNPASEGLISHYLCQGDPVSNIGTHMGEEYWIQPKVNYEEYNIKQFEGASTAELLKMERDGVFDSQEFGSTFSAEMKKALFVYHSIDRWASEESLYLYDGSGNLNPEERIRKN